MKTLQDFDNMLETLTVGASLEHKGWDSAVHNLTAAKGDQVFLYVHDIATRWTWMVSVARAGFHTAANMGRNLGSDKTLDLRHALSSIAIGLAARNIAAGTSEEEKMLGNALCLYAGGTKTFIAADEFKVGGHFCVILYRKDRQAEEVMLRPFALPGETDKPIPANILVDAVLQVAEIDKARHPEWFMGDEWA